MSDANATSSKLEAALKLASVASIILSLLAFMSHEEWLILVLMSPALLFGFCILASYFFPELLWRKSSILDTTGGHLKTLVLQRRTLNVIRPMAIICLVAAVLWYYYGHEIMPSASVTRFERSKIRYLYGSKHNSTEVPVNSFFIPTDDPENLKEILATSFAILTVTRNGEWRTKSLRIESIEFEVVHVPFDDWKRRLGIYPKNVALPIRYSVSVAPQSKRVKAHMLDEKGNPIEGTIILDNQNTFSEIHITFKAGIGAGVYDLYKIRPIITTIDENGRNRTELPCDKTAFVAVWNDANEPAQSP